MTNNNNININNFLLIMKKNFFYAMMSAIALTSAVSFTGCASDDGASVDTNPTYDGNSVRTDFAFNITKASQGTRMTDVVVQENDQPFRGMQDMYLYAMKTAAPTTEPSGQDALQTYALQSIAANSLDDDKTTTSTPSSKVYPLTIPVGTNNFLFYARALQNGETNFQIGKVTFNNFSASSKATSNLSFNLVPIEKPTGITPTRTTTETNFIDYLNSIAEAKDADNNTWAGTYGKSSTDARYSGIAKLYKDFARPDLNANEVRSGSAESIMRSIRDLYTSMQGVILQSSTTASDAEAEIHNIAVAVCNAIDASFFVLTPPANGLPDQSNPYSIAWKEGVGDEAKTYPASYDLPMGAAQLAWNSTDKKLEYVDFDYANPAKYSGISAVPVNNITYPAELLYFDNSPLIGTNQYKEVSDYPVTTTAWDTAPGVDSADGTNAFDASWTQKTVDPTTRAVAMRNNVNYGVALLESTVKIKDSDVTILYDNRNGFLPSAGDQSFTIEDLTTGNGFELTGILIGGQPGEVNWQMLPSSTTTFGYAIYDKDLASGGNWEINSDNKTLSKLYTVCFDNFVSGDQNDVCVALEFKNKTGSDFYGAKGLIPAGNTFYLVGKLSVGSGTGWTTTSPTYPTGYRVSQSSTPRVFGQDHKTVVTFNLNANSLKNAYSTIPDLRSTEMLFGLNVDLEWKTGLTFGIDL